MFAATYFCAIVPYSISFQTPIKGDNPGFWYTIDIICVLIYFLDIVVRMNTAIKTK